MACPIRVERVAVGKPKPDQDNLGFGRHFTDHMFIMDYTVEKGWHDPRVVPYGPLSLDPASMVFHYAQAIFEGMKAYRYKDGRVMLFRPEKNAARINKSNDRMAIPPVDPELSLSAIKTVVAVDKDWVPSKPGTSLYIRPFIIATEPHVGLKASSQYKFIVILSPVGSYYPNGMAPVNIYVEDEYIRAAPGGTGHAKAAGNYAGTLKATMAALKKGFNQVLWLDAIHKEYVEEAGTMNVFFRINGKIVTPPLGTILPGIVRESVIHILRDWGEEVEERPVSIQEIYQAHSDGTLEDAFGAGTAAVITPIGVFEWKGKRIEINQGKVGETSRKLYDTITGIQYGTVEDKYGWMVPVE